MERNSMIKASIKKYSERKSIRIHEKLTKREEIQESENHSNTSCNYLNNSEDTSSDTDSDETDIITISQSNINMDTNWISLGLRNKNNQLVNQLSTKNDVKECSSFKISLTEHKSNSFAPCTKGTVSSQNNPDSSKRPKSDRTKWYLMSNYFNRKEKVAKVIADKDKHCLFKTNGYNMY